MAKIRITDLSLDEALDEQAMAKVRGGALSPRDAASGLPTGKRQHKPVSFTFAPQMPTDQFPTDQTTL